LNPHITLRLLKNKNIEETFKIQKYQ
jgi:hypothetical protein